MSLWLQLYKVRMNMREAIRWIAREAGENIPEEDRARFIEVVETELSSLHEGNIARYRLRPSEFEARGIGVGNRASKRKRTLQIDGYT